LEEIKMAISDFLEKVGEGVEKGAKVAGTVAGALGKGVAEEEAGYAPQIAQDKRNHAQAMEDAAIQTKEQELTSQLEMGRKYGTLTPEQQSQYVDAITKLYSHPRHAATLMEKLRKVIHPQGAIAGPVELADATPKGGTAAADAEMKAESKPPKPLPKSFVFLDAWAKKLGKNSYADLTPDELVDAANAEHETKAAKEKEDHQTALEEYKKSTLELRKAEHDLHEAQFKASQDPNNPAYRLKLFQAQTAFTRANSYALNAESRAFGKVSPNLVPQNAVPLPGAVTTPEGETIGSSFANQYVKSAQSMAQLNDAGGAVNTLSTKLKDLYDSGGGLNNPVIAEALQHHEWAAAQVAQGIVAKTLNPKEREVVTAIISARENIQGMRKAAGGGLSNEQVNRLEAQLPGPETPNAAYAVSQLNLLNQTLQRLSEGVPVTVGGQVFKWEPEEKKRLHSLTPVRPVKYAKTATDPKTGHKVGTNDNWKTVYDVKTGKQVK
jgi:hypothetical protein